MKSESGNKGTLPDFHDGLLTGIVVSGETLELQCSTVEGEKYRWRLSGLRRLRADNFLQGNVIFEINICENDFPVGLVKRAFGEEHVDEPVWLPAELARLRSDKGIVLELTCSYGCDLLAVCDGGFVVEKL